MIIKIHGHDVIIDEQSLYICEMFNWLPEHQSNDLLYFMHRYRQADGSLKTIKLHRMISGATIIQNGYVFNQSVLVDHKDRNTLNNAIYNLRFCNKSQNGMNSKMRKSNSSGHKGVSWKKDKKKWKAFLMINGHQVHLGYYDNKEDAANARLHGASKFFGEFFSENSEMK